MAQNCKGNYCRKNRAKECQVDKGHYVNNLGLKSAS